MKLKKRFTVSNLIIFITSVSMIGVISVCFLIAFILKYPVEDLHITRAALLNPVVLSRAIGDFFQDNPSAVKYVIMWFVLCLFTFAVIMTLITRWLSESIQRPIKELTNSADKIRSGDLDFHIMGSSYDEIDALCTSFDSMRSALKRSKARERRLKEERNLLLANLSHDLKTPVTSIKGYIEGIRDGVADTPEKQRRYLDTIYAKAVMIDDMVNNLSMFSKLELSKLKFDFTEGDINAFLNDFVEDYRIDLEKNNIELKKKLENTEAVVKIDYEKMGRVFSNLIGNAIKYKKNGAGCLTVSTHIADGGIYTVIEDDGIGIAPSELEKVFGEFYRVDAARSMNIKGSGLGLGIAKQIVENHGGKLWLKSEGTDKGTAAIVYLPLVKCASKGDTACREC